ncbi:Inorganic pyrophosphatase [Methylobacterium crusticola]|uniref:inorganic diphosphatase n=1 Tax=Methylobacterium crusticola TaxID=1697972 RepID=A0ABQ4R1T7_9HYPH|nr:inorganic diphosphatase [Methylobacterium crusticola]GJD51568.1 Inorganic pyrophosphatase [Methylobacterium crusticola]
MRSEAPAPLPAFAEGAAVHVVIETPKGSRNKYAYDDGTGVFQLKGVLPEGMSFPYDYGYVPSTRGDDGDPLDVLVIMDAPAFPGCVMTARIIGAIEAEQTERDGRTERNDRLIGVATHAHTHGHVTALSDLRPQMLEEIEAFFEHYNRLAGKAFCPVRRSGADAALALIRSGMKAFAQA